jgi:hypothetical protein
MPRVSLLVDGILVGQAALDRVPVANERVTFSPHEKGNVWPEEIRGKTFHVTPPNWIVDGRGEAAEARVNLVT